MSADVGSTSCLLSLPRIEGRRALLPAPRRHTSLCRRPSPCQGPSPRDPRPRRLILSPNLPAASAPFLKAGQPFRDPLVVGCERTLGWSWSPTPAEKNRPSISLYTP